MELPNSLPESLIALIPLLIWFLAAAKHEYERRKLPQYAGARAEVSADSNEPEWQILQRMMVMLEHADKERNELGRELKTLAKMVRDCQEKLPGRVAIQVAQQMKGQAIPTKGGRLSKTQREKRNRQIRAMKAEGKRHREIASEVGVSPSTVGRVLAQA